jgi:hypothetical protein
MWPQLALHGKSEMVQLKAIEVLNKMQGYNEPEKNRHQHVHISVSADLLRQLRLGYAALSARECKADKAQGGTLSNIGIRLN